MHRIPLTLRALLLVPLFAVGIDQARAVVLCGPDAQSCLEVAGRGWIGGAGVALALLYAVGLALGVARMARGGGPALPAPGLPRLWAVATAGVALACAGQALVAGALGGSPDALAGGWPELAALCAAAGAVIALALRAAPAAAALVRSLRPRAPRLRAPAAALAHSPAPLALRVALGAALAPRGRAPPAAV